jgi:hypothetical protein
MKETTEQFGEVLVNSTEDISLAYPELFTHSKIQSLPFQIESLPFLIEKKVGEKTVTIKCFPYNNVKASESLMKLIEDKMQKYIHTLI